MSQLPMPVMAMAPMPPVMMVPVEWLIIEGLRMVVVVMMPVRPMAVPT